MTPLISTQSVLAHKNEPAKEADDKVFESDGKPGAGESQECAEIRRRAKDDEQDENDREHL